MASRFAEHPVGEPPGQAKLVSRQTHGPAGRIGRRSLALSGCFAKRSGGGSSELLGVRDAAPPTFGHLQEQRDAGWDPGKGMCVTLSGQLRSGSLVVQIPPDPLCAGGKSTPGCAGEGKQEMDIRIYVGNLAKSTTQDEITALFAQVGEVTSVDLVKDRNSGLSKGFAFVTMTSQESADKAISKYNAYSLAGNELRVNIAKPRVERP